MPWFIGHDLGTGGVKAVLADERGTIAATAFAKYPLTHPQPHWAEQRPDDWWDAIAKTTRELLATSGLAPSDIAALGCAGQMLALVPMGADARPTRPAISWLDARAEQQARAMIRRSGGARLMYLLAGALPTGKDIVAKIAWLAEHEPDVFARTAAFCDATGYVVARATGRLVCDPTCAGGTGIVDAKTLRWSRLLAWLARVPIEKLPPILRSTDIVGGLTDEAASDLGLAPGTPVIAGMADIPAAAVGSGATGHGDAHVYLGTSSWIGVTSRKPGSVAAAGIASVPAGDSSLSLLIGESETAGACVDWLLRTAGVADQARADLDALAASVEPGAEGLLFLPWMFGERSPVPDAKVRGAFINLSLEHGRAHLLRAVYEGVAHNLAWILDAMGQTGHACPTLRAIGGGAQSDLWLQVLADVTGRRVDRVADAQQAGALGIALTAAVATGAIASQASIADVVRVTTSFSPRPAHRARYACDHAAFRALYPPLARAARAVGSAH